MKTDTIPKSEVGRATLVVNMAVQDDAAVTFQHKGNDIIRLDANANLKSGETGVGIVDLQNASGLIIAASEPTWLEKGDRLVLSTFRAIEKVRIK